MKTKMISLAVLVLVLVANIFSANAQSDSNYFFDKKYEDGKVVSSTKYELVYPGLFQKSHLTLYTYNEFGQIVQKETFNWSRTKEEWIPQTRITQSHNSWDNSMTAEYSVWNKKENKFNDASEKAIYQLDGNGDIISLVFMKPNKEGSEDLVYNWKKEILYLAM